MLLDFCELQRQEVEELDINMVQETVRGVFLKVGFHGYMFVKARGIYVVLGFVKGIKACRVLGCN